MLPASSFLIPHVTFKPLFATVVANSCSKKFHLWIQRSSTLIQNLHSGRALQFLFFSHLYSSVSLPPAVQPHLTFSNAHFTHINNLAVSHSWNITLSFWNWFFPPIQRNYKTILKLDVLHFIRGKLLEEHRQDVITQDTALRKTVANTPTFAWRDQYSEWADLGFMAHQKLVHSKKHFPKATTRQQYCSYDSFPRVSAPFPSTIVNFDLHVPSILSPTVSEMNNS